MKAVICDGFGGIEVLKIADVEKPKPKPDQVLIKVMATSVNMPDIVQRRGKYPPPPGESEILGLEVAGIIEELGSEVEEYKKGDKVMALVGGGGYAEYATAYASHIIPIPESMSFEEAACVCEAYITAFLNVFMIGGIKDNDYVLYHGGGGGVNTAAIQLTRALTNNVNIIITASPRKMDKVKEIGANLVINYKENPNFSDIIKEYTKKRGVDIILDHVGATYLDQNIKSLAYEGRLIIIGVISGIKAELNLGLLMVKRQKIIGSVLRSRPVENKAQIIKEFKEKAIPKFADRTIVPIIYTVLPLEEVAKAHQIMEKGEHFGKIVLSVSH
ncbi:NAD(P)H-quinone oxidoreductase [Hippea maritima]|uniref:NAD(P)H quinone oxidoreductase, PIG3 family n=1 Tax=Hippea maritima (strain ATCC 700847 / DSM 10411 / MH2) TaxID=760142 RepID=F2LXG6_HIPMA|nr:NAD(P)H-quinone oxidoreductase [Hippea maritima]AEA34280.1 NAD(P)H quinone oxidoreductase, PIG3 family [Hippea maritima DSM 10411]